MVCTCLIPFFPRTWERFTSLCRSADTCVMEFPPEQVRILIIYICVEAFLAFFRNDLSATETKFSYPFFFRPIYSFKQLIITAKLIFENTKRKVLFPAAKISFWWQNKRCAAFVFNSQNSVLSKTTYANYFILL